MIDLTKEKVHELFEYHQLGLLIWRKTTGRHTAGDIAGKMNKNGYIYVAIPGYGNHKVHRLIFLGHYGYLPEQVDHKNQIKSDNWIDNLRDGSGNTNNRNMPVKGTNTSGVTGIVWEKSRSKWIARIKHNNHVINVGRFKDFIEAVAHRLAIEQCLKWNEEGMESSASIALNKYLTRN